jgi:hypothetical protein
MSIYILIKRYSDDSGLNICGATSSRAVAQAFHAGGEGMDPHPEVYEVDLDDAIRGTHDAYEKVDFDKEPVAEPEPPPVSVAMSDDDIPF